MRTRWPAGLVCLALGLAGCAGTGRDAFSLSNLFGERPPDTSKLPAASTRAATRVVAVGSALVAKNKQVLGGQPVFFTLGVPEVEISHSGSSMVLVSEGLVERCPTDTELAAVLAHELGKIAAKNQSATTDRDPGGPRLAPDVIGATYEPDMTRLAEEARFDRRQSGTGRRDRLARPDPRLLAEKMFVRAGYKAGDLGKMDQLIREAEDNADKRASELRK